MGVRSFIAFPIADNRDLRALRRELHDADDGLRLVAPENIHLTLQFLGDVERERLESVGELLERSARTATRVEGRLTGLGAFPNIHRPKVVWVGHPGGRALTPWVDEVRRDLQRLGFVLDERPWTPHVTVSRVRRRPSRGLFNLLHENQSRDFGGVLTDRVCLMSSVLGNNGPTYSVETTHLLGV